LRVALVDPSLFTAPYDHALMSALSALGDEVRLYAGHRTECRAAHPGADARHFYRISGRSPLLRLPGSVRRWLKGLDHAVSMRELIGDLAAWRPAVIHFQWTPIPIIDQWFLPGLRSLAATLCTVHDSIPFNGDPSSALQEFGATAILRSFDAVVVHTAEAYARLKNPNLGIKSVCRIPHGTLHPPSPGESRPRPLLTPTIDILAFGKIKPYKGLDLLIRALSLLSAEDKQKCHARIIGKPYMDTQSLVAMARSLGVSDIVQFDFRLVDEDQITDLFHSASVCVLPYRMVDASGVLYTAIASGCPVIATRIGGFAELLTDGDNALLVPANDPRALAAALSLFVRNPALRMRLAYGVQRLRDRTPSWREIGCLTHTLYERTVNSRQRRATRPSRSEVIP
jgi:glycosyltransferase involved in cell wall biosynthesis